VKVLVATGIAALILCAPAFAKFRISVAASDATPAVGQQVSVVVRSERALDYNLRLIAVAPEEARVSRRRDHHRRHEPS
jgi:hypothetical protein